MFSRALFRAHSTAGAALITVLALAGATGCNVSAGGDGGGGASASTGASCTPYIQRIVDVQYGPGAGFGQDKLPAIIEGPPRGLGDNAGSLDVLSLGNGGSITVAFGDETIVDQPGPDFIVFENPFYQGGDPNKVFAEIATVEVSEDGTTWHAFPCTATTQPYGSCAGWHPVKANGAVSTIDPLDPATAGGDAFDLADLGVASAKFIRITDRPDVDGSFDLDAIGLVHATCAKP